MSLLVVCLDLLSSLPYSVIMVETSGRPRLSPRQACAVESAARRSGLQVTLVMVSSQLRFAVDVPIRVCMDFGRFRR